MNWIGDNCLKSSEQESGEGVHSLIATQFPTTRVNQPHEPLKDQGATASVGGIVVISSDYKSSVC